MLCYIVCGSDSSSHRRTMRSSQQIFLVFRLQTYFLLFLTFYPSNPFSRSLLTTHYARTRFFQVKLNTRLCQQNLKKHQKLPTYSRYGRNDHLLLQQAKLFSQLLLQAEQ